MQFLLRDEDREKSTSDHLKSSSSEESVRRRRPSGNISINSQLSICPQNTSPSISSSEHSTSLQAVATLPRTQHQLQHNSNKLSDNIEPINIITTAKSLKLLESPISDIHYDTIDNVSEIRQKYSYHDEPHSFENSMDFLEDTNHFQYEVLETTV